MDGSPCSLAKAASVVAWHDICCAPWKAVVAAPGAMCGRWWAHFSAGLAVELPGMEG